MKLVVDNFMKGKFAHIAITHEAMVAARSLMSLHATYRNLFGQVEHSE